MIVREGKYSDHTFLPKRAHPHPHPHPHTHTHTHTRTHARTHTHTQNVPHNISICCENLNHHISQSVIQYYIILVWEILTTAFQGSYTSSPGKCLDQRQLPSKCFPFIIHQSSYHSKLCKDANSIISKQQKTTQVM
jgi:hypothetical protein